MSKDKKQQQEEQNLSRRDFLKNTGLTVGGIALGGGIFSVLNPKDKAAKHEGHTTTKEAGAAETHHAMMFFTDKDDFNTIAAAADRIFPETEEGPGAKELGVGYFIDHQLVGEWGNNSKEYHAGPFFESEAIPEQGYQTRLKRKEIFMIGIGVLRSEAQSRHKKEFFDLTGEEQDTILKDFESDKVNLKASVSASHFFKLLRQSTIEGVYSDPMYGGNKDMKGWKMRNYTGANVSQYSTAVDSEKFIKVDPQSLKDHMGH